MRSELNRLRREELTGMVLLDALSQVYTLYGLEPGESGQDVEVERNDELPRIVCSAGLVGL